MAFEATSIHRNGTTLRPITLGSPGEEISVKDLNAIKHRFMNLHRLRVERVQGALQPRQRQFLELLPLLFHCNFPALPGFVSSDTPAGIPDYTPPADTVKIAQTFSKSFVYKKRALRYYPIHGLYLMGSVGSIAYSRQSDLDIWLCHAPNLPDSALHELRQKTEIINEWAVSLGLETHFFFIDTAAFAEGSNLPISKESSGSTQHYLLLEEFYRTGLYVAGRIPAWWLVPPHEEHNYTAYVTHLIRKRFVDENEIIDFGSLEQVPADEFLSAVMWHLYKAIDAPHKSLLKLFLMESYASEYPAPKWLSLNLKQAVYEGSIDIDELDPYILMYKKVEGYLATFAERLDLARQCFYLKINELVGTESLSGPARYRREILDALVQRWGWTGATVGELDDYKKWNFLKASREQKIITRELIQCYQLITLFALEHVTEVRPGNTDIKLLGRKLGAALECRPGKIDIITATPPAQLREHALSLREVRLADGEEGWALYRNHVHPDETPLEPSVKKTRHLIEILAWAVLNGLYGTTTALQLKTTSSTLTSSELSAILQTLMRFLKKRALDDDTLNIYRESSHIEAVALFVNVARQPADLQKDGRYMASSRSDALSYSSMRINLVETIDVVWTTSWHEVLCQHRVGLSGLFDCLTDIINQAHHGASDVKPLCASFSGSRARSIALRVKAVYGALASAFMSPGAVPSARLIIRGEGAFFIFQRRENALAYRRLPDEPSLYAELAAPQPDFSPVQFERAALDASPLTLLYSLNRAGAVQVFCLENPERVDVYVLDERGTLFTHAHPPIGAGSVLASYAAFLNAMLTRHEQFSAVAIQFFDVRKDRDQRFTAHEITPRPVPLMRTFSIRVSEEELARGDNAYTLFCEDAVFSSMEHGEGVFQLAARHIYQKRKSRAVYPIYITDVDVPLSALGVQALPQLQMTHFLKYKQDIEARLNAFLPP